MNLLLIQPNRASLWVKQLSPVDLVKHPWDVNRTGGPATLSGKTSGTWPGPRQGQGVSILLSFLKGLRLKVGVFSAWALTASLPAGDKVHLYQDKPKDPCSSSHVYFSSFPLAGMWAAVGMDWAASWTDACLVTFWRGPSIAVSKRLLETLWVVGWHPVISKQDKFTLHCL